MRKTGYSQSDGKKKYQYKQVRGPKRRGTKKRMNIPKIVNKLLARKLEVKSSIYSVADGTEILHNNFITLGSGVTLLATSQGVHDPMNATGQCIQTMQVQRQIRQCKCGCKPQAPSFLISCKNELLLEVDETKHDGKHCGDVSPRVHSRAGTSMCSADVADHVPARVSRPDKTRSSSSIFDPSSAPSCGKGVDFGLGLKFLFS